MQIQLTIQDANRPQQFTIMNIALQKLSKSKPLKRQSQNKQEFFLTF